MPAGTAGKAPGPEPRISGSRPTSGAQPPRLAQAPPRTPSQCEHLLPRGLTLLALPTARTQAPSAPRIRNARLPGNSQPLLTGLRAQTKGPTGGGGGSWGCGGTCSDPPQGALTILLSELRLTQAAGSVSCGPSTTARRLPTTTHAGNQGPSHWTDEEPGPRFPREMTAPGRSAVTPLTRARVRVRFRGSVGEEAADAGEKGGHASGLQRIQPPEQSRSAPPLGPLWREDGAGPPSVFRGGAHRGRRGPGWPPAPGPRAPCPDTPVCSSTRAHSSGPQRLVSTSEEGESLCGADGDITVERCRAP